MNKMQVKSMMKKPWWSYALLLAGIFLFTEGCSLIYGSEEFSIQIPVILFSMIMHGSSLKDLSKRLLFKKYKDNNHSGNVKISKSCAIANLIMQVTLISIGILCYFVF